RLGGFNFIHHFECPCGRDAAIHLNKSRVDPEHKKCFLTRQHSKGNVAIIRPSCLCSVGPAHTPSTWLMSAETDESSHMSQPRVLQQHDDDACEPSVGSCSLISARRNSTPHQQLQQTLDDMSSVEASAVREDVHAVMGSLASQKLSKREKNHLKSLRRKQRKKERWLLNQLEKVKLQHSLNEDKDGLTCAVCLDIYISPHICQPCGHCFCEPCLRTIANDRPRNTPCPLCRTLISNTNSNRELDQMAQTFFPKVYCTRKQNFERASCAKWPLPSSRKSFCTFWRQKRQGAGTIGHWWFHRHGGYSLAALDQTNMHTGLFGLVVLYVRSANLIVIFLFLSVLLYYFCF
uniref:E3 ubiquitin-protein ligase RNF180-like n=1 Tax=Takifugu rubripes TaxID=31033 RepID=A0A674ND91_TAKRU